MRIREIIVEYDRGMTLKSWQQKLTARMASDQSAPETIDELMEMIESADPTRNKVYAQWIVKRYIAGDYNASDLDQVNLRLTEYDSVKRVLTTGKDINQLTYTQLPDIIQAGKAQKTAPKFEIIPDTEVLYNGPDGQLAVPKTETASRALGSGTAWCTAYTDRDTMFDHYNSSGNIYTWRAKNGDKFQFFWGDSIQFMNSSNKPMSPKDMHFYRSINPPTKKLFAKYEDEFIKSNNKDRILELFVALGKSQATWKEGLELIGSDPASAFEYADKTKKPFPAGEKAIATSAKYSYYYAYFVLGKPFPAGEAAIATDLEWATSYTQQFGVDLVTVYEETIKDDPEKAVNRALAQRKPFPAGEAAIATSAEYSYDYAYYALGGKRFPAGEPAIATSAKYSCLYAINVLKLKAFPLGEPAIITDDYYAQQYAQTVLTRYPSLSWEKLIKDNPARSYEYAAAHRLRFRGGEAAIATDPHYARLYDQMLGTNLSQQ